MSFYKNTIKKKKKLNLADSPQKWEAMFWVPGSDTIPSWGYFSNLSPSTVCRREVYFTKQIISCKSVSAKILKWKNNDFVKIL